MKTMTNQELEAKLAEAVDWLQPDLCSRAATASVGNAADLVPQPQTGRRPLSKLRTIAVAACLCLILMGGAGAYTWLYPAAHIGLDVNPNIELTTNTFDRVLTATALNADAKVVLESLQLRGVELDTAVSAIIGSIVQHGFLEQGGGEVRISVTAGSEKRILRLEQQISEDVRKALPQERADVAVTVKPPQQEVDTTTQTPTPPETKPQPVTPPAENVPSVDSVTEPTPQQSTQQNPQPQPPSTPSNGADTSNGKQVWIQRALALESSLDAATLQTYSVKQLRELVDDLEDQLDDADDQDDNDDNDDDDAHDPGKSNTNGNNRDHDDREDDNNDYDDGED